MLRHSEIDVTKPILCQRCGISKMANEFYKNNRSSSGRDFSKCKDCAKNAVFVRRRSPESRERILKYDRDRGNRQTKEYRDFVRSRDPVATKARAAVGNAIRDGKLEKPDRCAHCNDIGNVHGHHHDYTKPLNVTWLCVACHRQLHALLDTVKKAAG